MSFPGREAAISESGGLHHASPCRKAAFMSTWHEPERIPFDIGRLSQYSAANSLGSEFEGLAGQRSSCPYHVYLQATALSLHPSVMLTGADAYYEFHSDSSGKLPGWYGLHTQTTAAALIWSRVWMEKSQHHSVIPR